MDTETSTAAQQPILVLGGTGKTGRRVAAALRDAGREVRIGSRSARPPFDWADEATWGAALEGVSRAYVAYAPDAGFPGAEEVIGRFARRAADCGVGRLVLLSGRGEAGALRSERALRAADAQWTVVRSSFFARNFSEGFMADAVRGGELALPAGSVAEPFVDAGDVADVAAAALLEEGHAGRVYEVTGPRALTFAEALAEIGAAAGREISYLAGAGLPEGFAAQLGGLFAEVFDGRNAATAPGVRQALGREPRDFADYVAAAAGAWNAAGEKEGTDG